MTIDPKNLSATATLTFSDEFNTLSLWNGTSGTWNTNYWWGQPNGSTLPSNGEQEWYINNLYAPTSSVKPWTVNNGVLTLTAAPASTSIQPYINNYKYTSGMIQTYESFTQQYGYFEIRAQLPAGQGVWPAFWLLPANGTWPPEIDVFEVLGHDPTMLYTTMHTNITGSHTSSGTGTRVVDMSTGYHTYGVDWQADYITWYFDGNQVYKVATPGDWHQPAYMIANITLGGYWPGNVDGTTPFPAEMKIDYIRAYKDGASASPPPPPPPPPPPDPIPTTTSLFTLAASADWTSTIRGTARNDTLNGTSAANYIDGRNGTDTMIGGGGDDTYLVDRSSDIVTEGSGAGIDTVRSKSSSFTLPANVENGLLTANTAAALIGNALNNILTGNNYASTLNGGAGNDILISRGANILTGGAGSDIFQFDSATTAGRITDFTVGVDKLDLRGLFSGANYTGTNPLADGHLSLVSDGAGGTRVFFDADGTGGLAQRLVTTVEKVAPSSLGMQGDWFFSGLSNVVAPPPTQPPPPPTSGLFTLPTTGTGIDTVYTTATSYVAPADVENVLLGASVPQTVTGNSLNNIITSNNWGSTINAGAGNDIIHAGRSWDILTGGAGSDIFEFSNTPWAQSRITDFTPGTDMLDLRLLFDLANYQGTNPVADGYFSLESNGAGGTRVLFDVDGPNPTSPWWFIVAELDNVSPASLQMQRDWYFQ